MSNEIKIPGMNPVPPTQNPVGPVGPVGPPGGGTGDDSLVDLAIALGSYFNHSNINPNEGRSGRNIQPIDAFLPIENAASNPAPLSNPDGAPPPHDPDNNPLNLLPQPPNRGVQNGDGHPPQPISWDQRILLFFLIQLQNVIDLSLFSPNALTQQNSAQEQPQQGKRSTSAQQNTPSSYGERAASTGGLRNQEAQNSAKAPSSQSATDPFLARRNPALYENRPLKERGLPTSNAPQRNAPSSITSPSNSTAQAGSSRLILSELALKLLSIHQISQNFVTQQGKQSQQTLMASSGQLGERTLIGQVGKLAIHVEHLKNLLQKQDVNGEKLFRIVAEHVKEIAAELRIAAEIAANPQNIQQKEAILARVNQEVEWLLTLLATVGAKAPNPLSDPKNIPSMPPAPAPFSIKQDASQLVNLLKVPPSSMALNADQPKPLTPTLTNLTYSLTADGKTLSPIAIQIPKTANELVNMIQAHINKGVVQSLPIIIQFPLNIQLTQQIEKGLSSSKQDGKKNQKDAGNVGFGGSKNLSQLMLLIPAGPVIIGDPFHEGRSDEQPTHIEQLDPFLISATPVTNAQYASWLSDELLNKRIHLVHPGQIYDQSERLLALTTEGARTSQLELSSTDSILAIRPTPGRENHPVVHVTYHGAQAFCEANGLRLPTEAEWERAAGMLATEPGQPIKKLRYAFSSDVLNPSWAIFRETGLAKTQHNFSMPVGFFDGQKVYSRGDRRFETNRSVSPWGCSDMSGNVREWTSSSYDEDGLLQITKGGSYGDTSFDLRVAAKVPLPPTLSDPYTGFRVAYAVS